MPILATYRRLEALSDKDLLHLCRLRSSEWASKGYPDESLMSQTWRYEVGRLRDELARRGVQLRLF